MARLLHRIGESMAKRPVNEQSENAPENGRVSSAHVTEPVAVPIPVAPAPGLQEEQIAQLKTMIDSLTVAVQDIQTRNAQNETFRQTMEELQFAARNLAVAPAAAAVAVPRPRSEKHDCGECGCECVDSSCCCFEIVLDKLRGIQPQGLEVADMGDTAIPIPTINELEVRLFVSIDGVGALLLPSLSTTMGVRVPSLLAGGGPGLWMPIDRVIGRACIKKGTTRQFEITCHGAEIDEGIERPIGFKDEHGEATGWITLDCCMSKIYPPMPTDLYFDQGGAGGGNPGAISIAFYARRVCC